MRQGGPCSIWSATWTVGDADGNTKTRISGDWSKSTGRAEEGYSPKTKASIENSKSTASMECEEAWREFLFELQTSNSSFVCIR